MKREVIDKLKKGNTEAALERGEQVLSQLKALYYDWISVQGSFNDYKREHTKGTLSQTEYTLHQNKTNAKILELVKRIEGILPRESEEGTFTDLQDEVQSVLVNRYEIQDIIREGALTVLYKAKEVNADDFVSVRVLKLETPYTPSKAFEEAQVMKRINHRNIMSVIDYSPKMTYPRYVIMEYVSGSNLKSMVEENGPRPTNEIIHLLINLADALYYLHKRKVFNADLRPDRISIDDEGEPMFSPFIVFRDNSENNYHQIISNLRYMSYERLSVEEYQNFGPVSNQFSLGNIAYLLNTGQTLFGQDTLIELIEARMKFESDEAYYQNKISELDGHPELVKIITKLLSKERYPNMLEVKRALQRIDLDEDHNNKLAQESFVRVCSYNPNFAKDLIEAMEEDNLLTHDDSVDNDTLARRIQNMINLLIATNPTKNYMTKVLTNETLMNLIVYQRDHLVNKLLTIVEQADYLWSDEVAEAWRSTLAETFEEVDKLS